jgi:ABC-type enterochelin transport system substrate-binding protein
MNELENFEVFAMDGLDTFDTLTLKPDKLVLIDYLAVVCDTVFGKVGNVFEPELGISLN